MTINKLVDQYKGEMYFVARILVGYMFALHGAGKLGLMGGETASGIFLLAGIIELVVGIAVVLGAYFQPAAVLGAALMLVAFVWKHLGIDPVNGSTGGEAALLYLAAFMILAIYGPGKWAYSMGSKKK